jgi:hypothetical protein
MITFVVLFPLIAALLCVLVYADHRASAAMETARVREIDFQQNFRQK